MSDEPLGESDTPESVDGGLTVHLPGLKAGSEQARAAVWGQVFRSVVNIARAGMRRQSLERRTRDEEDIAISALGSFFRCAAEDQFDDLDNSANLWRLLATFTHRKIHAKRKYDFAQKRGGGTTPIRTYGEAVLGDPESGAGIQQILGTEPPPGFEMMMQEAMKSLPSKLRDVAILSMEGHGTMEIAQKLKISTRSVERRIWEIRQRWSS